jgi:hypothetical protein
LEKEHKTFEKQIKAAVKSHYYCQADAKEAAQTLKNLDMKYYHAEIEIEQIPKYKRGRPKGGVREIKEMRYGLSCKTYRKKEGYFQTQTGVFSSVRGEAGCIYCSACKRRIKYTDCVE